MARITPTQRTLTELKKRGYLADIVERFIPVPPHGIRRDFLHFIDIIALDGERTIGIQCCGATGHKEHKRKILSNPHASTWCKGNRTIELWSWRKVKVKRGGKQLVWKPRIEEIKVPF
jgi:hypothetical protein